jgi:hypothetical protein
MRTHLVVIVAVGFQDPTQMHLAQDNDVVHTLTPDARSAVPQSHSARARLVR